MRAVNRDPTHRKTKTNKYQPVHGWRPRCTDAPPQLELLSQDRPIGIAPRSRMSPACRCSTRPALERSPRSPKLSVFYDSAGQGNGEGSDLKDPALRVKSVVPTPPPKKKSHTAVVGFEDRCCTYSPAGRHLCTSQLITSRSYFSSHVAFTLVRSTSELSAVLGPRIKRVRRRRPVGKLNPTIIKPHPSD